MLCHVRTFHRLTEAKFKWWKCECEWKKYTCNVHCEISSLDCQNILDECTIKKKYKQQE